MLLIADTSVWIDHLRRANPNLISLLKERKILLHSAIIGELACGTLPKRSTFLEDLKLLPKVYEPSSDEVLELIEKRKLYSKGLGWIDVNLLASSYLSGVLLWTLDKRLQKVIGKH